MFVSEKAHIKAGTVVRNILVIIDESISTIDITNLRTYPKLNFGKEDKMKILFITLISVDNINERGIYTDLLREFIKNGHCVYVVSPAERRSKQHTRVIDENNNCKILKVQIGNIQKTNILEKGMSTLLVERQFKKAIAKHFSHVRFNLILYSTPPVTFAKVIKYIKKRDNAKTYLLLKDIFPQNAVDLEMISTTGWKSIIYAYFRSKEKQLYAISDRIGCMSQANVDYVIKHNPEVDPAKVEICPNCIEVQDLRLNDEDRLIIREKYGIPSDKKVFVYGGNLGKPQGIPFIIECLKSQENNVDAFFLIIGDGTEYGKLKGYFNKAKPSNMMLLKRLPKDDYDSMIAACDVGMIFLDYRFTIPNFPSRLLSYMQAGLPVLACTDLNTDIRNTIIDGKFGWWFESNNVDQFIKTIEYSSGSNLSEMGYKAFDYLNEYYAVATCYKTITNAGLDG